MGTENRPHGEPRPATPRAGARTDGADDVARRVAAHAAVLATASAARMTAAPAGSGAVANVTGAAGPDRLDPVAALRLLGGLRAGLDEAERQLIEAARAERASWARIATALGLASRQAAEQRWVRLCGATTRDPARIRTDRRRQQIVDNNTGAGIGRLRVTVTTAFRRLSTDPDRDGWHPRARLALTTLGMAAGADEPGALYALASKAVEDLEKVPPVQLTAALPEVLDQLRHAVLAATPEP
ncbi:hypothetical protein ACN27G_18090 [Plantactinospora sp. WMMB334]|uniref:hypothetical protein n=1 Tax=Plantactinospora sp. WMMB334 TaxID=3404119 RepID=UPI003B934E57